MNSSSIELMSYVREEPGSPGSGGPPAYDNPGFSEQVFPGGDEKAVDSSLSSNDLDDTTAANTYANAARPGTEKTLTSTFNDEHHVPATPPLEAAINANKGADSPVIPPAKHKDSTVGFRLPEVTKRDGRRGSLTSKDVDAPYRGMGKEDLLRHSGTPFWRRLRYICMSVVMIGWLALIITVVALVLVYPRCRDPPAQGWWKKAVVYRIYVRSFQDHDGDGIGDLEGIRSQLGYLKEIGVTTISLSAIYPTPDTANNDGQVLDHTAIAPEYGTVKQFIDLVNSSHAFGIRVILDFIPNHTALEHPWFQQSENSSETSNPKRNYYVWQTGLRVNSLVEPNNWRSMYNSNAWTESFKRNQYYLHQFSESQPDLNLRSSEVQAHLLDILQTWLDRGVDGFYVKDSGFLFEDYDIRNNTLLTGADPDFYDSYNHTYTYGRDEIHDMFARWRAFLDKYGNSTKQYKLLYADRTGTVADLMQYYGRFNRDGVNFPLNLPCLELNQSATARDVGSLVRDWMKSMPSSRWANWLGGTDSSERMIDRLGEDLIRPFLTLIMLLPGTPMVYYGDEIGMSGLTLGVNFTEQNSGQRNLSMRTPMQWDNTSHAGFCKCNKGQPWMTINPQYMNRNVDSERAKSHSIFQLFTNLTSLRASYSSFHYGDYNEAVVDDDVFSFVRDFDGEKGFLVALNFANKTVRKQYYGTYHTIPTNAIVTLRTGSDVRHEKGHSVSTSGMDLGPRQGVVLSWDYVAKEL